MTLLFAVRLCGFCCGRLCCECWAGERLSSVVGFAALRLLVRAGEAGGRRAAVRVAGLDSSDDASAAERSAAVGGICVIIVQRDQWPTKLVGDAVAEVGIQVSMYMLHTLSLSWS